MTVKIDTTRCTGCGACTMICPVGVLELVDMKSQVSPGCIDCGQCVDACSWFAITLENPLPKKKGSK
jgi:Na+-translocating ferredoxin:NAD+ oxidoreductase subunit B